MIYLSYHSEKLPFRDLMGAKKRNSPVIFVLGKFIFCDFSVRKSFRPVILECKNVSAPLYVYTAPFPVNFDRSLNSSIGSLRLFMQAQTFYPKPHDLTDRPEFFPSSPLTTWCRFSRTKIAHKNHRYLHQCATE